ncbi:DNA ligase D [Bdellovibrio sp. HCB2-146]|uniref:DNA ligase D n=1 Tax=Bdellovibrio sp. HCB2-146 TaxID=3394362 RepID=UPI0039BD8756
MSLRTYSEKRNFKKTSEPKGKVPKAKKAKHLMFVVQEHHASHLHYDFRLEWEGVLKSWAVPKGPSLDPGSKRLAVEVEDHPLEYGKFEGVIPEKQYGAGEVYIWDTGVWNPLSDPAYGLRKGHLEFELKGKRLKGRWDLIRTKTPGRQPQWLLIKKDDAFSVTGHVAEEIGTSGSFHKRRLRQKKLTFIQPQLSLLVDAPPEGTQWLHETKFDGYRLQVHIENGEVRLWTRSQQNWTDKFPTIEKAFAKLKVDDAIFDGELVWLDEKGHSSFQKLQNALKDRDSRSLYFYAFDLLWFNGKSFQEMPLLERKKELDKALKGVRPPLRVSTYMLSKGTELFKKVCDLGLEGIISKRKDRPYISGRKGDWTKAKCGHRQEFVIGGYTEGEGSRSSHLGALLLGIYEGENLRYVGKVGTGFTQKSLQDVYKTLHRIESDHSPFDLKSPKGKGIHWVTPIKAAEVSFGNWTDEKILRTPVFHGLREDKSTAEISIEKPTRKINKKVSRSVKGPDGGLRLSNPQKIIYPAEGLTKLDAAMYYVTVADFMLEHLKHRPLSLLRCPEGSRKNCFFQKHVNSNISPHIHEIAIEEKHKMESYMTVSTMEGLAELAQMGAFEIHCWGSHDDKVDYPDVIVMDLDPGPGVSWNQVVKSAFEMKEILEKLKLKSFVKLSGGKGVHLHIPIARLYTWDQVKAFSKALAQLMEDQYPQTYVSNMNKKLRNKKIFVDYLRNGRGATAVAPYSLRSGEHSAVAMPITWAELKKTKSSQEFSLPQALAHLKKRKRDPWEGYFKLQQKLPQS